MCNASEYISRQPLIPVCYLSSVKFHYILFMLNVPCCGTLSVVPMPAYLGGLSVDCHRKGSVCFWYDHISLHRTKLEMSTTIAIPAAITKQWHSISNTNTLFCFTSQKKIILQTTLVPSSVLIYHKYNSFLRLDEAMLKIWQKVPQNTYKE